MSALAERVARLERERLGVGVQTLGVVAVQADTPEEEAAALWREQNPGAREPSLLVIVQTFGGDV
jgi:hypothetical protein